PVAQDLGSGWSGQNRVDGDASPTDQLCKPPRYGELCCLCHAVVDHLLGNRHRRLAADENDPSPPAFDHPGHVVPCGAHATHDIELEQVKPLAVLLLKEAVEVGRAEVVDKNVGIL